MKTATSVRLISFWFLLVSSTANAALIEFIYTGSGSGNLDGNSFGQSDFTITQVFDTDNIQSCGSSCIFNNALSASIMIDGLGAFDFISSTRTFATSSVVGFSRGGQTGLDLFGDFLLANYDLASDVATIFQTVSLIQWSNGAVDTTGGVLEFDSSSTAGSFTARLTSVSEPATIGLLFGGLVFLANRKRRAK